MVPGFDIDAVCVPFIYGNSILESKENVIIDVDIPQKLFGEIEQGKEYGSITIKINDMVLDSIPLIADRTSEKANFVIKLADFFLF